MKKFILFLCCFLLVSILLVGVLIFVPFSAWYEKGPKARYRVEEGSIDIFSLKDGRAGSLLKSVGPGESFTALTISAAALKIPFGMGWMEPVVVAAVGRANLFMLQQSKKSRYREFAVAYTDESIQRGFVKEIEKTKTLSNLRINFYVDGFSIFARVGPVPISVRGYASTQESSGRLFLRLRWVKIGKFFVPDHVLRALENIFATAYVASHHPAITLVKITFGDRKMIMFFRKEAKDDVNILQQDRALAAPEIIYPYGS